MACCLLTDPAPQLMWVPQAVYAGGAVKVGGGGTRDNGEGMFHRGLGEVEGGGFTPTWPAAITPGAAQVLVLQADGKCIVSAQSDCLLLCYGA